MYIHIYIYIYTYTCICNARATRIPVCNACMLYESNMWGSEGFPTITRNATNNIITHKSKKLMLRIISPETRSPM